MSALRTQLDRIVADIEGFLQRVETDIRGVKEDIQGFGPDILGRLTGLSPELEEVRSKFDGKIDEILDEIEQFTK